MIINVEFENYLAKNYQAKVESLNSDLIKIGNGLEAVAAFKEEILTKITEKGFKLNPDSLNRVMEQAVQEMESKLSEVKEDLSRAIDLKHTVEDAFEGFKQYLEGIHSTETIANPPAPVSEPVPAPAPAVEAQAEQPKKKCGRPRKDGVAVEPAPAPAMEKKDNRDRRTPVKDVAWAKKKPFANWLLQIRESNGLTNRQMADCLGIPYTKYYRWESGIDTCTKEATARGVVHALSKAGYVQINDEKDNERIISLWTAQRAR